MTRAQLGFIMVGDYTSLTQRDQEGTWKPFFDFFWKKGWCCGEAYKAFSATACRMIQDPVLEQPRTVYSTAGAAISSSCDFTADDAQHLANCMVRSCKALISYESFFRIVDFVLGLPKHKYTVEQRPSDVWKYDRKIWSHECVLYRLTVKHDATNYVYFFA